MPYVAQLPTIVHLLNCHLVNIYLVPMKRQGLLRVEWLCPCAEKDPALMWTIFWYLPCAGLHMVDFEGYFQVFFYSKAFPYKELTSNNMQKRVRLRNLNSRLRRLLNKFYLKWEEKVSQEESSHGLPQTTDSRIVGGAGCQASRMSWEWGTGISSWRPRHRSDVLGKPLPWYLKGQS